MLPMGSSLLNQGIKDGAIVEVKKVSEVNMAPIQKDVILPPTAPSSEEAVKEKRKSIRDIFDKRKSLREALKLNMNDLEEQEKRKSITLESPKDGSKSPKDGNKSPKGTADDKKERRKSLKDAILQLLGTTPLDEKALQEKRNSKRLSQKFSDLFSMLKSVPEEQFMQ
jgi:septal ring factor EnvC (AmiA/AmiB activator)